MIPNTPQTRRQRLRLIPLILTIIALAVRLFSLTYHSLWFDEVMSTFWAAKPAGDILRVGLALTQDKHPPLYYLLLHFWTGVFGGGDVAVRSLGALIGALAVLPVYGIGSRLGSRLAGLLAALLLALNPFLVWYSQEARMFMPATTFGMVGLYGVVRGMKYAAYKHDAQHEIRDAFFSAVLIICGFTAALYTYLFSAFLLPVAGAWLLLGWWLNRREPGATRRLWLGMGALGIVGILFLPLARAAWSVSGGESLPGRAFADMGPALWRLLQVYTVGWPDLPGRMLIYVVIVAGIMAVVGLIVNGGRHVADPGQHSVAHHLRWAGPFLALWLGLPILAGGLLLARDRTVFGETRYFIFLVPVLCLTWGQALAWLWQWRKLAGGLVLAMALGLTLAALPGDWSAKNRREAWRETAQFVEAHAGSNDAVLVQADYVHLAFARYFHGPQPVYFPFTDRLSDPARVDPPLEGLAQYDAVWVVQSHHQDLDPGNLVAGWFGARFPLITEAFPAGIAVHGFAQLYRPKTLPVGAKRVDIALGDLRLAASTYQPNALPARDDLFHPPSGWVHVTTYWTPGSEAPAADVFPSVRLVDRAGQVWGDKLDRSGDAIHIWRTSHWLPGEIVRVDYDVNLNPLTPPGQYRIVVSVPGNAGEATCGDVTVTR